MKSEMFSGSTVHKRAWTFAAATGATALVFLDETIVTTALSTIQSALALDSVGMQWAVNAYVVAFASLLLFGGRLGDIAGHRRVFVIGLVVYAVASLMAGFATNEVWLLTARAGQGIGAALASPAALAMIADAFTEHRGRAVGLMMGIAAAFLVGGPAVGGVITEFFGWRWVFWISVPLAGASVWAAMVGTNTPRRRLDEIRIDVLGTILFAGFIGSIVVAVMQGSNWGWFAPGTLTLVVVGVASGCCLVLVETRQANPMFDPVLRSNRGFVAAIAVGFGMRFAVLGPLVFLILYFTLALQWSPLLAGVAAIPALVPSLVISPLSGSWSDRSGPRKPIIVGVSLMVVSLAGMAFVLSAGQYWQLLPGLIAFGSGAALAVTPTTMAALSSLGGSQLGMASGALKTARQVGGALSVAVVTAVFTSTQRSSLATHGLTSSEADAILSRAAHATTAVPAALLRDATRAFVDGAVAALLVVTGVAIVTLIVAVIGIRNESAPQLNR